jgi:hypothetical protein
MTAAERRRWHLRRMEIPNSIRDVALLNPTVDRILADYAAGDILTVDEALCRMVVVLSKGFIPVSGTDSDSGGIEFIQKVVADYFRIHISMMTSAEKTHHVAHPRQAAMYLCRELLSASGEAIGAVFGGRCHGTVMHAVSAVKARIETEPNFATTMATLSVFIKSRLEATNHALPHTVPTQ